MGIVPGWKDAFTVLQVLSVLGISMFAGAHICEVGREKDETDSWRWVLAHGNPCGCHKIVMGGVNTRTPIRPYKPKYVDSPMISEDIDKIRKHYELDCKAYWGDFGNWSTCSATCNGSQSREAKCIIPEFTKTPCKGAPPNETRECNIGKCPVWSEWGNWTDCSWSSRNKWSEWDLTDGVICGIGIRHRYRACINSSIPEVSCYGRAMQHQCCETLDDLYACQLGIENNEIPDKSLSSSSTYTASDGTIREAKYARLNFDVKTNFWASDDDDNNPWIQVDLGEGKTVNGIIIQGSASFYIKKLNIAIAPDDASGNVNRKFIKDKQGNPREFDALSNPSDVRTISFDPVTARYIRLEPIKDMCLEDNGKQSRFCCLRFEVLGCFIEGWSTFDGSFYYLVKESKTYDKARDACVEQNAVLISVGSQEEQDFINDFLSNLTIPSTENIWIGLNDRNQETYFTWEDGSQYGYKHWGKNQPDDASDGEDCVHLYKSRQWNDRPCNNKLNMFICEIDIIRKR